MLQQSAEMQACIDACLHCHAVCLGEAMTHCLEAGGRHLEPQHFRLMIACAEICASSARFMLISTPHHRQTCAVCAEVCAACADSCRQVGEMERCVEACQRCAASCRRMAA